MMESIQIISQIKLQRTMYNVHAKKNFRRCEPYQNNTSGLFFLALGSLSTPVATNSGTMKNRHFLGEKNNNVGMKMHCSNGWGDIGLIFSWEAASAGCRAQEPMVGSQPACSRSSSRSDGSRHQVMHLNQMQIKQPQSIL